MTHSSHVTNSDKTRDHLANERTFLAWIRTSISIIVFGFVVSKFGITLKEFFRIQLHATEKNDISLHIGVSFILMGIILAFFSIVQYQISMRNINANQFKPNTAIITLVGLVTGIFGFIMVTYLIYTARAV